MSSNLIPKRDLKICMKGYLIVKNQNWKNVYYAIRQFMFYMSTKFEALYTRPFQDLIADVYFVFYTIIDEFKKDKQRVDLKIENIMRGEQ